MGVSVSASASAVSGQWRYWDLEEEGVGTKHWLQARAAGEYRYKYMRYVHAIRYTQLAWLGPRIYFGGALAVAFVRVEYLGTLTWRVSASFVSMKKAIKALH